MKLVRTMGLLAGVVVGGMLAQGGLAQSIRLREQAVVVGPEVRVGEIAAVEGADAMTAEALAQTIVMDKAEGTLKVKAEEVLFAVIAARGPEVAAKLMVRGSAECVVRVEETRKTVPAGQIAAPGGEKAGGLRANRAVVAEGTGADAAAKPVMLASVVGRGTEGAAKVWTLSGLITEQVVEQLGARGDEVRVDFETASPLLEQAIGAGQRWLIRPMARGQLGLGQWEVQLVEGSGKSLQKLTVTGRVTRRVPVAVAVGMINRGEVVTAEQVKIEERWVDRKIPSLVSTPAAVVGMEAQRGIAMDTMLDQRDFRAIDLVARGDAVDCYLVTGALKVKFKAKAMSAGKLHDRVTVCNDGTGERFEGTLIGKRLVALGDAIDQTSEKKLREERR